MVQDLFGPRISSFELVDDPAGGPPTLRVQEGEDAFPAVGISASGIGVAGSGEPPAMRSDNEWLIYNLEASEQGIADIVEQAAQGRFSKLVIRDGIVDMTDSVYGLFRRFEAIDLEIGPTPDRRNTSRRPWGGAPCPAICRVPSTTPAIPGSRRMLPISTSQRWCRSSMTRQVWPPCAEPGHSRSTSTSSLQQANWSTAVSRST
jgi:hypothetical protein